MYKHQNHHTSVKKQRPKNDLPQKTLKPPRHSPSVPRTHSFSTTQTIKNKSVNKTKKKHHARPTNTQPLAFDFFINGPQETTPTTPPHFPPLESYSHTCILDQNGVNALLGNDGNDGNHGNETKLIPETKKLKRQQLVNTFPHVFHANAAKLKEEQFPLKNNWNKQVFRNDNRIVLELGCGIGQYIVGLAEYDESQQVNQSDGHIQSNYIGLEKKGSRLYIGAVETLKKKLKNCAFVCGSFDFMGLICGQNEISELWLTFPDQNFHKNEDRHITSPHYMPLYNYILKRAPVRSKVEPTFAKIDPESDSSQKNDKNDSNRHNDPNVGIIHLKTDQDEVFDYTMDQLREYKHEILEYHYDLYDYLGTKNEQNNQQNNPQNNPQNPSNPFQNNYSPSDYDLLSILDPTNDTLTQSNRSPQSFTQSKPSKPRQSNYPLIRTSYLRPNSTPTPKEILKIKTFYEGLWSGKGKTIKYVKFRLNPDVDYDKMMQDNYLSKEPINFSADDAM